MSRLLRLLLVACLMLPVPTEAVQARQGRDPAEMLLERMTPEERVGQLFIVTFRGSAPRPDDPIFDLIVNGHISGVVLRTRNDNFTAAPDTLRSVQSLIAALQRAEYNASYPPATPGATVIPGARQTYVPLFIGISQEGDGSPFAEILSGMTNIPSQMALGATWSTELAETVGHVLGQELQALGFNLLLGPSLDVLENPRPEGPGDLGVRAFGGDPYWVGTLGEAFIAGVQRGSAGHIAVIAKHFPGHGGSDRPLEEEVATVRKSLDALRQIELAPFFAVTDRAPGAGPGVADGLLRAHIRYQGFQDNIRATTRPVSLDPQAFQEIMALEPLAQWRASGGITMSDSLGSRAVRRFYDPREQTFRGHLVARDAFLAGNDLLYLSSFQSSGDADEAASIRATLAFFAQKYAEDDLFAQLVDQAVLRILRLKFRLAGGAFSLAAVVPTEAALERIGGSAAIVQQVARSAATLLSPTQGEIEDRTGGTPRLGERIVFITDVRPVAQCSTCPLQASLEVAALESAVLRLYGPTGGGQVGSWSLSSISMADLAAFLGEPVPSSLRLPITPADEVDETLANAHWLVFSLLGSSPPAYGSNALRLLLDRRPDLVQRARTVVFTFGPPYDLDATDVSKIDLYYALYSKSPSFVEIAARLLFQELSASGASPVSIAGIGYDLLEMTSPTARQVIPLAVLPLHSEATPGATPGGYSVGDRIRVATGVIRDHNGHPVPDGTVVEFTLAQAGDLASPMVVRATTFGGVAEAEVLLDRLGPLTIAATSDPALASEILLLDVQEGVPAFVTVITPTALPSESEVGTQTPPAQAATPGAAGTGAPDAAGRPGAAGLALGLLVVALVAGGGAVVGGRGRSDGEGRRMGLIALVAGLAGYNYVALGLPGSAALGSWVGWAAGPMVAGVCGVLAVGIAALRARLLSREPSPG